MKKFEPGHGYTQADWDAVQSPPLTDAELASMRPFAEVFPELSLPSSARAASKRRQQRS